VFTVKSSKPQLEYMSRDQYAKLETAEQGTKLLGEIDKRANASAATQALTVGKKKKVGRGGETKRHDEYDANDDDDSCLSEDEQAPGCSTGESPSSCSKSGSGAEQRSEQPKIFVKAQRDASSHTGKRYYKTILQEYSWRRERWDEFGPDCDAFLVSVGHKTGNTGQVVATVKDGNTAHAAEDVRDVTNAGIGVDDILASGLSSWHNRASTLGGPGERAGRPGPRNRRGCSPRAGAGGRQGGPCARVGLEFARRLCFPLRPDLGTA
jgi:hypothetical protein